jgi:hypothetical protein
MPEQEQRRLHGASGDHHGARAHLHRTIGLLRARIDGATSDTDTAPALDEETFDAHLGEAVGTPL